ncbi:ATP-binding protein [Nonomuraea sp. NN258]|uniref:ATP-binding protein n=1 Tax=Nonomuraea antri TaxID=2730852 RepID=UPI001568EF51|nr:ATP-binding protein [Nonomuraea antri]NRQ33267.1 ATP-binding protein [Nonomuraea antri]
MSAESIQMPDVSGWKGATLPRSAKTPRHARQAVRRWLAGSVAAVESNALLVVSELVTNVIQHVPTGVQRDWVKVRLGFADDFVRVEVIDPGTTRSQPRFKPLRQGSTKRRGRGLGLVADLSVRCGTHIAACGDRIVWADLAAGVPDAAQEAIQDIGDSVHARPRMRPLSVRPSQPAGLTAFRSR